MTLQPLPPDRVRSLWQSVEQRALTADDAMREQERLVDELRAVWTRALLGAGEKSLEAGLLEELATYFDHADPVDLERRCREATRRLKVDWLRMGRPDARSIERFYEESEEYIFDLMWWHTLRDDRAPLAYVVALEFARQRGCRRFLDFGSGVGSGAILFARHGMPAALADISPTLLDFARWRFTRRTLPATFIDLKNARLPHRRFDIITAMDVFEHLTDPVAVVDDLAAALVPGGYIFGRFAAETDEERPQHIVVDFAPTLARLASRGFVEVWRDDWLWGHQVFQKPAA